LSTTRVDFLSGIELVNNFIEKHSKEIAFGLVVGKDFKKMGEKIYSLPLYAII
jgi:hypothetical protein